MRNDTTEARFWAKVTKGPACWEWTGAKHSEDSRYGKFWDGTRQVAAHRWLYEQTHGHIPAGMELDHMCHTPECVRPDHLRLATRKQNQENRKGAQANNHSSGVRNVYRRGRRWVVRIRHNGKKLYIGTYDTIAEADVAATRARSELFTFSEAPAFA